MDNRNDMDAETAIDLAREALMMTILLAAPVLGVGLIVALIVSLLQAVTQVQEQTLSFVPKILAMLLTLVILGSWMLTRMVEFSRQMFGPLP